MKMRWRNVILLSVVGLLFIGWLVGPRVAVWSMALASKKGEESSQAARDRIVFFGQRAIQPTIASIEKHSPWVRRYCYLPSALEKIGGSAHADLLAAIDAQGSTTKKAYLISALQTAFDDYSRFDWVLAEYEAGRIGMELNFFASEVRYAFPDAPKLLTEDRILNPAFKAYWSQHGTRADVSLNGY